MLDRDTNGGVSKVGHALVYRAREIAEWEKVYRIPTPENVLTSMLLDPLTSREWPGFRADDWISFTHACYRGYKRSGR